MKKLIFFLLILTSQMSFAQGQFSLNPTEFEQELTFYLKIKKLELGESIATDFLESYNSKFNVNEKIQVIEVLNKVRLSKIKNLEYYQKLLKSISLIDSIKKGNGKSVSSWLELNKKYFSNKKIKRSDKQKFIISNYNVIVHNVVDYDSKNEWKVIGKIVFDASDDMRYSFSNSKLICTYRNDSLAINKAKGYYSINKQIIKIETGKVYWDSKKYSSDSLYVTMKNFDINVKNNSYQVDSVYLTNKYLSKEKILGVVKDKTKSKRNKKNPYPIFTGYENKKFDKVANGIDFYGIPMIKYGIFYGIGDEDSRAKLVCYNLSKKTFVIRSNIFTFSKKGISSYNVNLSIYIKKDSIYHSSKEINYDFKLEKLTIKNNSEKISKSAFSNTYNNLDMYLNTIVWVRDSTYMYFDTDEHVSIPFTSNKYYEKDVFKMFQGVNTYNPLLKLRKIHDRNKDKPYLSIDFIAKKMRMPEVYATNMLMELASLGYINVDLYLKRVIIGEKFSNFIKFYEKKLDYDEIIFQSIENTPTNGRLNLNTGETSIIGIGKIILSDKNKVFLLPKGKITITKNLNFRFDGNLFAGKYEFDGSDYNFNYDDFKVVMNGNQKVKLFVKPFIPREDGNTYLIKVINQIDSLKGNLYINKPDNKSGNKILEEYPKLKIPQRTYVFYNHKEILDSIYKKEDLYVKLYPFEIDSLNSISPKDIDFKCTVFTNNIFPDFDYFINVQKDYSLGFSYNTDGNKVDLYNKAKYESEVTLNTNGLSGKGKISYLSSKIESEDIVFYPDSLTSKKSDLMIAKVDNSVITPSVNSELINVYWSPNDDIMTLNITEKPFKMYDDELSFNGELVLSNNRLTGSGNIYSEKVTMNSKAFKFFDDYYESDNANLEIRKSEHSISPEFRIVNAYAKVDLKDRKGHFSLKKKGAYADFVGNKYIAYLNDITWNVDDENIILKSTNKNKKPWFISSSKFTDSLRFQSKYAVYDMTTNEINASFVDSITIVDAVIYPDSMNVAILDGGVMKKLDSARVKIGIDKNEHKFVNASISIRSSTRFKGSAEYKYIDINGDEQPIVFDNMYVDDEKNTVIGKGRLLKESNFMLNPYFSFRGKVEISGESEFLNFDGISSIKNNCNNLRTGGVPLKDYIDPNNVKIDVGNFASEDMFLYSGIYSIDNSYNAAFLATDRRLPTFNFISSKGNVSYSKKRQCYTIKGDSIGKTIGNEMRFYNEECKIETKGHIDLKNKEKVIDVEMLGEIDYDLNSDGIAGDVVLAMNFQTIPEVMNAVLEKLTRSEDVSISSDTPLQKMAFARLINSPDKSINKKIRKHFRGNSKDTENTVSKPILNEKIRYTLLFRDLNIKWNSKYKVLISDDSINIHSFFGEKVNKTFNGKIEIKRDAVKGDEYTIYFDLKNGDYYYFRYRHRIMDFYSNNEEIMRIFDNTKKRKRKFRIGWKKYRIRRGQRLKVKAFKKKYMMQV